MLCHPLSHWSVRLQRSFDCEPPVPLLCGRLHAISLVKHCCILSICIFFDLLDLGFRSLCGLGYRWPHSQGVVSMPIALLAWHFRRYWAHVGYVGEVGVILVIPSAFVALSGTCW